MKHKINGIRFDEIEVLELGCSFDTKDFILLPISKTNWVLARQLGNIYTLVNMEDETDKILLEIQSSFPKAGHRALERDQLDLLRGTQYMELYELSFTSEDSLIFKLKYCGGSRRISKLIWTEYEQ